MYIISFLSGAIVGMVAMYFRLKKGNDFILEKKDISERDF